MAGVRDAAGVVDGDVVAGLAVGEGGAGGMDRGHGDAFQLLRVTATLGSLLSAMRSRIACFAYSRTSWAMARRPSKFP